MKFSVCVDALFRGKDFVESMNIIKELGFDTIEFWSWWNKDIDIILAAKERLGLNIHSFCTRSSSLTNAAMLEDYITGLKESIVIAKKLGVSNLISQVGNELQDISRKLQHYNIVNGLRTCVPLLEEAGITLIFEPLNTLLDHKGYYLYSSDEAFEICEEVNSSNVKVLFDIYHQQIMEGNLISRINKNIDKIGHFHAAGNPGRHELSTGELNYANIFQAILASKYSGYMGLEYFPLELPSKGLSALINS
jgi:hydroxypyruvate isomerase